MEPAIVMNESEALALVGHAVVVKLPLAKLISDTGEYCFPSHEDLLEMAENGIARSARAGFLIAQENAAEVMREEADLLFSNGIVPEEFAPILASVMLRALEEQKQVVRQGE